MQQIVAYIREKTVERLDLLRQYDRNITTTRATELSEATKAALASYMVVRTEVERLASDLKTKAEAQTLLQEKLEPLYQKLQDAIEAEVAYNKSSSEEAGRRIE